MNLNEAIKCLKTNGFNVLKESVSVCRATYGTDVDDFDDHINVEVFLTENDGSEFKTSDIDFIAGIYDKIVTKLESGLAQGILQDSMNDSYDDGVNYIAKFEFFFDATQIDEDQAKNYIASALANQNITAIEN